MTGFAGKRYWIVGASDGLGAALARRLSAAGAKVIISARSEAKLQALADDLPGRVDVQPMDVSDAEAIQAVAQDLGEIDGMIYAAGLYWPMRAQDLVAQEAIAMADVNFTGLVRVLGQVLRPMVARDRGHIVIIGSLSGFRGLPGAVGYAASKAGVMALAEALAVDLYRSGVKVQLVNPGFIKTRLTDKNDFRMPFLMDPDRAAEITLRHMQGARFQRNFPRGFSWVFRLSRLLPDWAYHRIFAQR